MIDKILYFARLAKNKTKPVGHASQSVEAVECTRSISAEGQDSSKEYPGYETKPYIGETLIIQDDWGMLRTRLLP